MGKDILDERVGAELRKARNQAGLTLDEMSVRLNKKPTTISEYERGIISMTLPTFMEFCRICGVDPVQIIAKAKSTQ